MLTDVLPLVIFFFFVCYLSFAKSDPIVIGKPSANCQSFQIAAFRNFFSHATIKLAMDRYSF